MRILVHILTGDQFSQSVKFPMNGISDVKSTSGNSEKFPSDSKKPEEWPDWNEPEETENQTVGTQIVPPEPCDAAVEVPRSGGAEVDLGAGAPAAAPGTSGEQAPILASLPLTAESMPLKSSPPQKTSFAQSRDDPDKIKPPKVLSQERPPKLPSELGLGEEFTIQVKKKPVQDPELDWFADMIPEIKPSATFLILPELRTEMMVPSRDDVSPGIQFSSKFAAAEMSEVSTIWINLLLTQGLVTNMFSQ